MEDATLHFHNNKLYILGGIINKEVTTEVEVRSFTDLSKIKREDQVSRGLYSIDIDAFNKTENLYKSIMH